MRERRIRGVAVQRLHMRFLRDSRHGVESGFSKLILEHRAAAGPSSLVGIYERGSQGMAEDIKSQIGSFWQGLRKMAAQVVESQETGYALGKVAAQNLLVSGAAIAVTGYPVIDLLAGAAISAS